MKEYFYLSDYLTKSIKLILIALLVNTGRWLLLKLYSLDNSFQIDIIVSKAINNDEVSIFRGLT